MTRLEQAFFERVPNNLTDNLEALNGIKDNIKELTEAVKELTEVLRQK